MLVCILLLSILALLLIRVNMKIVMMKPLIRPLDELPPKHYGSGIDPSSVMIFMIATPEIYDYSMHSIQINREYCRIHGYKFSVIEDNITPDLPINFAKIEACRRFMEDKSIKYIVHVDADAVFVEPDYPITAIISSYIGWGTHMIIGEDCYSRRICSKPGRINSGIYIVKNTLEGKAVMDKWLDSARTGSCKQYVNKFPNCQLVFFNCVLLSTVGTYVKIVPYNLLNGYDGLFIKHMMQHTTKERVKVFEEVKKKYL